MFREIVATCTGKADVTVEGPRSRGVKGGPYLGRADHYHAGSLVHAEL